MGIVVIPVDSDDTEEPTILRLLGTEYFNLVASAALDADCLLAERILIDCNEILVFKDCKRVIGDCVKVTANDKWSLGERPQSKVGALLLVGETVVTNLEHIGVVPVAWSSDLWMQLVHFEVVFD